MQARYEQCYVHVMQVLKDLTRPGTNDTLSIADRSSARKILLQVSQLPGVLLPCFLAEEHPMSTEMHATIRSLEQDQACR